MFAKTAFVVMLLVETAVAADKPKVFISGENSFQVNGSAGEEHISGTGGSTVAEGIKLFQDHCSAVTVRMRRDVADYIVSVTDDGLELLARDAERLSLPEGRRSASSINKDA